MLDLNDLSLFVRVVDAGSFSAAAREVNLPANTVSRRIRALEESLEVRLLQRSTRRLSMTAAGAILHAGAADPLRALADVARAVAADSAAPHGTVRVAAPIDFFGFFRMAWIADFARLHPRVTLEFHLSDARADLLGDGMDLAFRVGPLHEPTLVARRVGTTRNGFVASPAYIAAHGTPASIDALAAHDGVVLRTSTRRAARTAPADLPLRERFAANSIGTLLDAVLAGIGIALLPFELTDAAVRRGDLVRVLPDVGTGESDLNLVWLSGRLQPVAVRALIDFIVGRMAPRDAAGGASR